MYNGLDENLGHVWLDLLNCIVYYIEYLDMYIQY